MPHRHAWSDIPFVSDSVRLGRIAGVPIGINWSWLLGATLIAWSLAAGVFPDTNPDHSEGTHVLMAVVATVAFFVCLLLHELGHALQARRDAVEIEGITLWIFGGVARFGGELPSAAAELRIALAGPAVSLVLGVVLLAFAGSLALPDAVDGVVYWLGSVNLVLLAFNMLPAFPLDGGRVARALLWMRKGNLDAATQSAVAVSQTLARVLIAGGLAIVIFGGAIGGVWLAFIGWFLLTAAQAELTAGATRAALAGLTSADVMAAMPVTVSPETSLAQFADGVFFPHRYATYPVTANGHPVGLLPFRAVAAVPRAEWESRTAADTMIGLDRLVVTGPDDPVDELLPRLAAAPPHRALVLDNGRLVGLVSLTDLARLVEMRTVPTRS
jgi:Zn-dependent protease/CBS domain-containing protein